MHYFLIVAGFKSQEQKRFYSLFPLLLPMASESWVLSVSSTPLFKEQLLNLCCTPGATLNVEWLLVGIHVLLIFRAISDSYTLVGISLSQRLVQTQITGLPMQGFSLNRSAAPYLPLPPLPTPSGPVCICVANKLPGDANDAVGGVATSWELVYSHSSQTVLFSPDAVILTAGLWTPLKEESTFVWEKNALMNLLGWARPFGCQPARR